MKLQFVRGTGFGSRLISWWGNGYGGYSHVDGILDDNRLAGARSDKVGGQPPGFQIRPPAYEKWAARTVVTIESTDDEQSRWQKFLISQVGEPYDKSDIIGLIIGEPMASAGHWICSAAQTAALNFVGKMPCPPIPPQQVTPNSLLLMCSAIGAKIDIDGASPR
jgi:hypothetical protein